MRVGRTQFRLVIAASLRACYGSARKLVAMTTLSYGSTDSPFAPMPTKRTVG